MVEISVCEKSFLVREDLDHPPEPYRFEKVIDADTAYLVDADRIIWILINRVFERPCLKFTLDYIRRRDPDFKDYLFSQLMYEIQVEDPRSTHYDEELLGS